MKITVLLSLVSTLLIGAEQGLLLHTSFDTWSTVPVYAANPKTVTGGIRPELQMRMYKGPAGKNAAVMLTNPEFISYTHTGNFNPRQGTVSFWVQPVNWDMSNPKYFQTFFEVRSGDCKYRMIINKRNTSNLVSFSIDWNGKGNTIHVPEKWKKGEWHKIDCTWNSSGMKMYIDGVVHAKDFKSDPGYPESIRWAEMQLNFCRGWITTKEWKTGYDELKIYNRVLSPSEILSAYEAYFPSKKKVDKPYAVLPAVLPVNIPTDPKDNTPEISARVKAEIQGKNLVLNYFIPTAAVKYDISKRDGELWLNDAVEFHVIGGDGVWRQFIVNAAGALYDSKAGKFAWNSQAKSSASRQKNSWTAKLEIPLSDLGGGNRFQANFCLCSMNLQKNSYTWSTLGKGASGFADKRYFGTVELGTPQDSVELYSTGNLRAGDLNISYKAVPGIKVAHSVSTSTGSTFRDAKKQLPSGKAYLSFAARKGNKTVFSYYREFVVNPPLTMQVFAYYNTKQLECRLDFSGSGLKKGTGSVVLTNKGKVYAEKKFTNIQPESAILLSLPGNLPDKTVYTVTAKVNDLTVSSPFRVPDMKLFRSQVAVNHDVPAPWTKVQQQGKTLKILDRVYSFDKSALPSGIVSRGETVLQGQPQFVLNGKPFQWNGVRFGRNYGDYQELSSTGTFAGGKALLKGELWFDGMYRFDLSIIPSAPLKIESLNLTYTMPRAAARYALTPAYTAWNKDQLRLMWDTREYHSLLWLTGVENGLAWWCKSDANWIINPNIPNIFVDRDAKQAKIVIKMFANPAILAKTAKYTMVFQATPPKHPNLSLREVHFGCNWFKSCDVVDVTGISEKGVEGPDYILHWTSLVPAHRDAFRKQMQKWHAKGFKTKMYGMPTHISRLDDEYDYFIKSSLIEPSTIWESRVPSTGEKFVVEPCCANTPVANLHAYRLDDLYRRVPELDGLYFDIMHVRSCENPHHGCGGVDAFGKKYKSSIALNLRTYTLRVLKIHQKHKRLFGIHAHSAYYPFVHDLGDYWLPGEELFNPIVKNPEWGYLEEVTPEAYQSAWNQEIRGMYIRTMSQHTRIPRCITVSPEQKKKNHSAEYAYHYLAVLPLYDIGSSTFGAEPQTSPLFNYWKIMKSSQFAKAKFHGYWIDPAVSAKPPLAVSWYSWDGKAPQPWLLAVVNTSRTPAAVQLTPDWSKLKVRCNRVRDLWTNKTYTWNELSKHQLKGHNFMMLVPVK